MYYKLAYSNKNEESIKKTKCFTVYCPVAVASMKVLKSACQFRPLYTARLAQTC